MELQDRFCPSMDGNGAHILTDGSQIGFLANSAIYNK
jgi:hypothetical protein